MQVAVIQKRFVEVRKAARERIEKAERENLCLGCLKPIVGSEKTMRKQHLRCYYATLRAINAGKTTEEEMVSQGKLAECAKPGRKASNPISVEFSGS